MLTAMGLIWPTAHDAMNGWSRSSCAEAPTPAATAAMATTSARMVFMISASRSIAWQLTRALCFRQGPVSRGGQLPTKSLRLQALLADDAAVAAEIGVDSRLQLGRRARLRHGALADQLLAHVGSAHGFLDIH